MGIEEYAIFRRIAEARYAADAAAHEDQIRIELTARVRSAIFEVGHGHAKAEIASVVYDAMARAAVGEFARYYRAQL